MRLVPIQKDGQPEAIAGELSETAREICAGMAALYSTAGYEPPWIGYLALVEGQVVGGCGFKKPIDDGRVEIAYFTFPDFEQRGYASAMAKRLVAMAAVDAPGVLVTAQTLPEENASTKLLKRLNFQMIGAVEHPDDGTVWEWHFRP